MTVSAKIAIALAAFYVVQIVVVWTTPTQRDYLGDWLGLKGSSFAWWEPVRLFTYALVHDEHDPLHVTFNALSLFLVGTILEHERGRRAVVASFVLGVVVGGFAYAIYAAATGSSNSLVGASGGVLAVIVGAGVAAPRLRTFLVIPLWALAAILVGLDLVHFMNSLIRGEGGPVAYVAHLGGALAGLVLGLRGVHGDIVAPRWAMPIERMRSSWRRRRLRRERRRGERLDRLLQKIHDHGMDALSASERRFLVHESETRKRGDRTHGAPGERRPTRSGMRGGDGG
ncbi:MAG TPA: rhomboid family intramembrane serine protease [Planctomycetota bacterium]|nr:rhomboid family intramembrane serine protease [Planctomycetota bacterium]